MSEMDPYARLEHEGTLDPVMERICDTYGLGDYAGFEVIPVGYEDFNARLQTVDQDYFVKIFASSRSRRELARFGQIMTAVSGSGISHPEILAAADGALLHTDIPSGLSLTVMEYVGGETFFDAKRTPNDEELDEVLRQAAMINALPLDPPFINDGWAITNIEDQYSDIRQYLSDDERQQVEAIIADYSAVDHEDLPHCFVHGDITKSNIIRSADGKLFVIDFSVANTYPRVQELAVIIGNLMNEPEASESVLEIMKRVVTKYVGQGGELTNTEMVALPAYVRAAYAMEFIGSSIERYISGNDSEENDYWRNLGWSGITRSMK